MVLMKTPAKKTQLHPLWRAMKRPEVCIGLCAVFSMSGDLFSLDTILLTQFVHEITEWGSRSNTAINSSISKVICVFT